MTEDNRTTISFFIGLAIMALIAAVAFLALNPTMIGVTSEAGDFFAQRIGRVIAVFGGVLGLVLMLIGMMNLIGKMTSTDDMTRNLGPKKAGAIKLAAGVAFLSCSIALVFAHL